MQFCLFVLRLDLSRPASLQWMVKDREAVVTPGTQNVAGETVQSKFIVAHGCHAVALQPASWIAAPKTSKRLDHSMIDDLHRAKAPLSSGRNEGGMYDGRLHDPNAITDAEGVRFVSETSVARRYFPVANVNS